MMRLGGNVSQGIESDRVELSTVTAVLAILIAFCVNGCDSDKPPSANEHVHHKPAREESIATRPYIAISIADLKLHPAGGTRFGVPLNIPNLGQRPANTRIKSMITYSAVQLSPPPGLDKAGEERRVIQPGASEAITAYPREPITAQQADDIEHGRGWIYLIAEVLYDGHTARVCQQFAISAADPSSPLSEPVPAKLAGYTLCGEPESNHFD